MKYKTLLSLSAIFAAGTQCGMGELSFQFITRQTFRQNPSGVAFRSGEAGIYLYDGNFVFRTGCNMRSYTNFAITSPCYPASNAWVYAPNDPRFVADPNPLVLSPGPYAVIDELEPNIAVEAAYPERVRLRGIPDPRCTFTLGEVVDDSVLIVGARTTGGFIELGREYRIADYEYMKQYSSTEKARFDTDVVPNNSSYKVEFPARGVAANPNSNAVVQLAVQHRQNVEGLGKVGGQYRGHYFTTTPRWVDGYVELDPRGENTIRWSIVGANPVLPSDVLYINFLTMPADDANADPTGVFYPNFGNNSGRVKMDSPLVDYYTMLPGFFSIGPTILVNLAYERAFSPSGNASYDVGTRTFQLPVKLRATLAGSLSTAFPSNTPAELQEPDADYDGDGYSNFEEWVSGSSPTNKNSVPSNGSVVPISNDGGLGKSVGSDSTPDGWSIEFDKVAYHESKVKYSVEVSEDLNDWREIGDDDPYWEVINDLASTKLKVISRNGEFPSGSFFRRKVVYTP